MIAYLANPEAVKSALHSVKIDTLEKLKASHPINIDKLRGLPPAPFLEELGREIFIGFSIPESAITRWISGKAPVSGDRGKRLGELLDKLNICHEIIYKDEVDAPNAKSIQTLEKEFDECIVQIANTFGTGEWIKARNNPEHPDHKVADLTVSIGDSQLKGRDLVGAVVEVMSEVTRRFREFEKTFNLLLLALEILGALEDELQKAKSVFSLKVYIDKIASISDRRIYHLFLYYTYLTRTTHDSDRMQKAKILLGKNHVFSLLANYKNRLNYGLVEIHDSTLFAAPGEVFWNYYWQWHTVREGETIEDIVQIAHYYDKSDRPSAITAILHWIKLTYGLSDVQTNQPLRPILAKKKKTNIQIVPPKWQLDDYENHARNYSSV